MNINLIFPAIILNAVGLVMFQAGLTVLIINVNIFRQYQRYYKLLTGEKLEYKDVGHFDEDSDEEVNGQISFPLLSMPL